MNNKWWFLLLGAIALASLFGAGCNDGPSGKSFSDLECPGCDSLFLGFRFGMTEEAFFEHCRQMNAAGILYEGNTPNTVSYKLDGFTVAARTLMLPTFSDGKISRFDMRFQYEVLPMFRPDLTIKKLMGEAASYLSEELAIEFTPRDDTQFGPVLAHREGYRQLFIYPKGEFVWATFLDLRTVEEE
jgi:hypothetical protein